jgi:hypothetical protein
MRKQGVILIPSRWNGSRKWPNSVSLTTDYQPRFSPSVWGKDPLGRSLPDVLERFGDKSVLPLTFATHKFRTADGQRWLSAAW